LPKGHDFRPVGQAGALELARFEETVEEDFQPLLDRGQVVLIALPRSPFVGRRSDLFHASHARLLSGLSANIECQGRSIETAGAVSIFDYRKEFGGRRCCGSSIVAM